MKVGVAVIVGLCVISGLVGVFVGVFVGVGVNDVDVGVNPGHTDEVGV